MAWWQMLMPVSGAEIFWPGLVLLGVGVGLISGFFGMGGGWMVTPGLNILGFPMAFAIGTGVTQMAGPSLVSTVRHSRFGNVDYKLGLIMVAGTISGFEPGARLVMWLEKRGQAEMYVQYGYLVLLTLIAWLVFTDIARMNKKGRESLAMGRKAEEVTAGIEWHKTLHKITIPPVVTFPKAGIRCSVWLPVIVSFTTGLMAGIMGIGGGLIRMPALIYLVGCPTHVAVGTDLFEVTISSLYGAGSYSYKGRTELLAALIMLIGASVGAQIGSVATKYAKGQGIRLFFGISVAGCAVSILLRLIAAGNPAIEVLLDNAATVLILGLVGALSMCILWCFLRGVQMELKARALGASAPANLPPVTGEQPLGQVSRQTAAGSGSSDVSESSPGLQDVELK